MACADSSPYLIRNFGKLVMVIDVEAKLYYTSTQYPYDLFGLIYRDPTQFGSIQTNAVPNPDHTFLLNRNGKVKMGCAKPMAAFNDLKCILTIITCIKVNLGDNV